jgi:hypothetical protein
MKKGILVFVVIAFTLAVIAPVFAEDAAQEKAETKVPLRKELVQLKYLTNNNLFAFIQTYLSREGRITPGPKNNVVVISDFSENVDMALKAIRQVDVKPADLQFTVQLILGAAEEEKGREPMLNDPVIRELRNLLKYKSYSLLDTSLIRAMDISDSQVRMGEKADFEFWIRPKVIRDEKTSLIQMEVRLRQIRVAGVPPNATSSKVEYITTDLIGTTLNIKPGDKTVVGVSKLDGGDKGLILIISGKIVD